LSITLKLGLVEGVMIEIKGADGVLRIELEEEELRLRSGKKGKSIIEVLLFFIKYITGQQ